MPKASADHSTVSASPARRSILAGFGVGVALASVTTAAPIMAAAHPDAELIHLCAGYMEAVTAYNGSDSDLEPEDDPLWATIEAIKLQVDGLTARTMAGLAAKARVAFYLAQTPTGCENFCTSYTGDWPEQVVRDLLAMHGDVA